MKMQDTQNSQNNLEKCKKKKKAQSWGIHMASFQHSLQGYSNQNKVVLSME